jgi:hypothetical protein
MNENKHTVLNPLESGKISLLSAPLDDTQQGHMHIFLFPVLLQEAIQTL